MKNINKFFTAVFIALTFVFSSFNLNAQEINLGADIVSKYMWRGLEINKAPNIQPSLSYSNSGFEAGFWGSYALVKDVSDIANFEIDAYVGYSFGDFGLILTDYYFPEAGTKIGKFDGEGAGAHTLEIGAAYSGPISIAAYYNFHNDVGNNIYFEIGYSTSVGEVGLDLFVGGTPGSEDNPGYYGSDNLAIINIGVTASKSIKITDDFQLPVFTSFIINPKAEIAYMVFGVSL
ncbi:MAG: hypothetical protein KJ571_06290 [Bacteroidetes bacterium]|nr:hypothetical protein [Bacteroidota bacterium]